MRVVAIPPSKASIELRERNVRSAHIDRANVSAISVHLVDVRLSLLPEGQVGHVLLRALAERLTLLWCVDAADANSMFVVVAVEQRDRVAVGNAYNSPLDRIPDSRLCRHEKKPEEQLTLTAFG